MTPYAYHILIGIAAICAFFAAIGRPATSPVSLGWLGFFFYLLALLIAHA